MAGSIALQLSTTKINTPLSKEVATFNVANVRVFSTEVESEFTTAEDQLIVQALLDYENGKLGNRTAIRKRLHM